MIRSKPQMDQIWRKSYWKKATNLKKSLSIYFGLALEQTNPFNSYDTKNASKSRLGLAKR